LDPNEPRKKPQEKGESRLDRGKCNLAQVPDGYLSPANRLDVEVMTNSCAKGSMEGGRSVKRIPPLS